MSSTSYRSSKHENSKCILSFDLSTRCLRAEQGKACAYCYSETAREVGGGRAKAVVPYAPYEEKRWPLTLRKEMKKRLMDVGGVRMFSFSDYRSRERNCVSAFLTDALMVGLRVKAITKVPLFLMHHHDHEALQVVHLSVDSLKSEWGERRSPIGLRKAVNLKRRYHKVKVRAVCLSEEDVAFFGDNPDVDILTLNHGQNGFKRFSRERRLEIAKKYPGRVCCASESGTCEGCPIRCGV